MKKLSKEEMKKVIGGLEVPVACDPVACEAKSSPTLGTCLCTKAPQCVCVS